MIRVLSVLKKEAISRIQLAWPVAFPNAPLLSSEILAGQVVYPENFNLAHIAFPCHFLAKSLRLSPVRIAEALSTTLLAQHDSFQGAQWVSHTVAVQGYVNFFYLLEKLLKFQLQVDPLSVFLDTSSAEDKEKVLVEYSQPNTHKALHVGHVRNMVYGEAICRLLESVGCAVVRATYPGDLGTHIAKSLWYMSRVYQGEIPTQNRASWLGRMYAAADQHLQSIAGTSEELLAKQEIGNILKELENQQGSHFPFYQETRSWSLQQMREVYDWLGIHFDAWYYESECDAPSRAWVKEQWERGVFVQSQGAIGMDLSAEQLGFALLLKSDGTGLYLTKDLELLRRKTADFHPDRSIVVVDSRQKLHFQQLFKVAEKLGYPHADRSLHLAYESVTDETGKPCSSRDLTGVPLDELKSKLHAEVMSRYLESYRGIWADSEIESTAEAIALGALKYGFLKVDAHRIIRFVLEDWIQLEGDTGPYLQYAHARCRSILEKQGIPAESFQPLFTVPIEGELLLWIERFPETLAHAAREYRPSIVCNYLFDLAKLFNRFYKECSIKAAASSAVKDTRLALVLSVAQTLKQGLQVLGIMAPERL